MSLDTELERHDLSQPFVGLQMRHKVGDKVMVCYKQKGQKNDMEKGHNNFCRFFENNIFIKQPR